MNTHDFTKDLDRDEYFIYDSENANLSGLNFMNHNAKYQLLFMLKNYSLSLEKMQKRYDESFSGVKKMEILESMKMLRTINEVWGYEYVSNKKAHRIFRKSQNFTFKDLAR